MITSLSSGVNVLASPSSGSLRGGSISGTSGTSIASNLQPGSAQSTTVPTAKNDTTVTLIRPPNQTTASFQQMGKIFYILQKCLRTHRISHCGRANRTLWRAFR